MLYYDILNLNKSNEYLQKIEGKVEIITALIAKNENGDYLETIDREGKYEVIKRYKVNIDYRTIKTFDNKEEAYKLYNELKNKIKKDKVVFISVKDNNVEIL